MDICLKGAGAASPSMGYLRPLRVRGSRRINQDGLVQLYVELVGRVAQKQRKPKVVGSPPSSREMNAT